MCPDRFKVGIAANEARYPLLMTKSIEVYLKDRRGNHGGAPRRTMSRLNLPALLN